MLLKSQATVVGKGHQSSVSRCGDAAVGPQPPACAQTRYKYECPRPQERLCVALAFILRDCACRLVPPLLLSGHEQGTLVNTLREVEPTSHMGVPRVWEKIMERIQEVAAQSGFIRRKMLLWAMSVTLEQNLTCPSK